LLGAGLAAGGAGFVGAGFDIGGAGLLGAGLGAGGAGLLGAGLGADGAGLLGAGLGADGAGLLGAGLGADGAGLLGGGVGAEGARLLGAGWTALGFFGSSTLPSAGNPAIATAIAVPTTKPSLPTRPLGRKSSRLVMGTPPAAGAVPSRERKPPLTYTLQKRWRSTNGHGE
jgi:hypothetical protein